MESSGPYEGGQGDQRKVLDTADKLNVPSVLRSEVTVQEYLQAHVAFEEMQTTMNGALEQLSIPETNEDFVPPPNVLDESGQLISLGSRRKKDITQGLSKLIESNYERTVLILALAEKMTEEGLHATTISPELIKTTLDSVLDEVGLYVAPGTTDDGPLKGKIERLIIYGNRLVRHQRQYDELHKAETVKKIEEDPNLEKVIIARDRQSDKKVAGLDFTACPKVHQYAEIITAWHNLRLAGGKSSPIEHGSYQSADSIRWSRIHDLMLLAGESLKDGINGNEMNPHKISTRLNYFLDPYRLHIEDKPLDKRMGKI